MKIRKCKQCARTKTQRQLLKQALISAPLLLCCTISFIGLPSLLLVKCHSRSQIIERLQVSGKGAHFRPEFEPLARHAVAAASVQRRRDARQTKIWQPNYGLDGRQASALHASSQLALLRERQLEQLQQQNRALAQFAHDASSKQLRAAAAAERRADEHVRQKGRTPPIGDDDHDEGARMLVCYYTTKQAAPYWPKDAREFMVPADGLKLTPLDTAGQPQQTSHKNNGPPAADAQQQAFSERLERQQTAAQAAAAAANFSNPAQLLIKSPELQKQALRAQQMLAGGQMVVISPPASALTTAPHYLPSVAPASSSSPSSLLLSSSQIVRNQLDNARPDNQQDAQQQRQSQKSAGLGGDSNNSGRVSKQQLVQLHQQQLRQAQNVKLDNGLIVGASSPAVRLQQQQQQVSLAHHGAPSMSGSLADNSNYIDNGANIIGGRDQPNAKRSAKQQLQLLGFNSGATGRPVSPGAVPFVFGVEQSEQHRPQLFLPTIPVRQQMQNRHVAQQQQQSGAFSSHGRAKSLQAPAGDNEVARSMTSMGQHQVVFSGAPNRSSMSLLAAAAPGVLLDNGAEQLALMHTQSMDRLAVSGAPLIGSASNLVASQQHMTSGAQALKYSLAGGASTMSVDFAPSNLIAHTVATASSAPLLESSAAAAVLPFSPSSSSSSSSSSGSSVSPFQTTRSQTPPSLAVDDERQLIVSDRKISSSATSPIATPAVATVSTSMTSASPSALAQASALGSSTVAAAGMAGGPGAPAPGSTSYLMLDRDTSFDAGVQRQQAAPAQPYHQQQQQANNAGNSLSAALVSSPLATMFDVFGAASQYLMRFKPSSLLAPSSFGAPLNTLVGEHVGPSMRFSTNGQHSARNSSSSSSNNSLLTNSLVALPFSSGGLLAGAMQKPAPSERSSSHGPSAAVAAAAASIGATKSSSSAPSAFLSRLSTQSGQQRRDEICGRTIQTPERRIIGGEGARYGEFPYQVHIKIAKHQCGGALVDKQSIVTAAHCVYHFITRAPVNKLQIVIGAYDIEDEQYQELPPQYFKVNKVKLHPNFRFSASHPDRYDIAILKLDKPVKYMDNVLPVCLPGKELKFESQIGTVTGFGKTDPSLSNRYGTRLLQKVDVPIIENSECERWHRTRGIDLKIFPEMMCAGYEDGLKDACVGDSGGPLVVKTPIGTNGAFRWTLAGITSAGFGCAQSRQPGIYHRVSHTVDWILENID